MIASCLPPPSFVPRKGQRNRILQQAPQRLHSPWRRETAPPCPPRSGWTGRSAAASPEAGWFTVPDRPSTLRSNGRQKPGGCRRSKRRRQGVLWSASRWRRPPSPSPRSSPTHASRAAEPRPRSAAVPRRRPAASSRSGRSTRWAYVPLWYATGVAFVLLLARGAVILSLRRTLGLGRSSFQGAGRWTVVVPYDEAARRQGGFSLSAPVFPRGPLVLPGLVFVAWILVQLVPWSASSKPLTRVSPESTRRRGLSFVLAMLAIHLAAGAVFVTERARGRFLKGVSILGLAVAFSASPTPRPAPSSSTASSSPSRATTPSAPSSTATTSPGTCCSSSRPPSASSGRVGAATPSGSAPPQPEAPPGRPAEPGRHLAHLLEPAPLAAIGALLATTSRGGLLAFALAFTLAILGLRGRRGVPSGRWPRRSWSWPSRPFGLQRLEKRFVNIETDAPGRTLVWKDALARWTGCGSPDPASTPSASR